MPFWSAPEYGPIVAEHRDRLGGLGSEYIEAALGRKLVVVDPRQESDPKQESPSRKLTRQRPGTEGYEERTGEAHGRPRCGVE